MFSQDLNPRLAFYVLCYWAGWYSSLVILSVRQLGWVDPEQQQQQPPVLESRGHFYGLTTFVSLWTSVGLWSVWFLLWAVVIPGGPVCLGVLWDCVPQKQHSTARLMGELSLAVVYSCLYCFCFFCLVVGPHPFASSIISCRHLTGQTSSVHPPSTAALRVMPHCAPTSSP